MTKIHHKLLLALTLGAALGTTLRSFKNDWAWISLISDYVIAPVGQVFLRLVFMIVVPMVFSGLVLGVHQLGKHHGLGKVASKTLFYTLITSLSSVLVGLFLVNIFKPGQYVQLSASSLDEQLNSVKKIEENASAAKSVVSTLVEIIPVNPLESAVNAMNGEMLSLMFFALFFGLGLAKISSQGEDEGNGKQFILVLEDIYAVCMKIVDIVMKLSPVAVFALIFNSTFKFGFGLLFSLLAYVLVVLIGLAIQQFGVYALILKFFGRRSPWAFFRDCRDVYLYAFATASSNATLPKSLEVAEHKLKLPPSIARFVLTVGSTANQNGTALFEGITVLFLAQVYGIQLDLSAQIQVIFMSVLAGVGTAGVPGGSLPLIMILLKQVGIPPQGIGLILGVDRILDMCRTTVNVSGDLVIAALVSTEKRKKNL